ncbi:hypothetical protein [Serratia proteamaculans]
MTVVSITAFHATKIMLCFQQMGIVGTEQDYKIIYRDTKSNFLCNVHTGKKKGLTMELQNSVSNPALAQILLAIAQEPAPFQSVS